MELLTITYMLLLILCFIIFVYSWVKISQHIKKETKWAVIFVPLSLLFDVISDAQGNKLRVINLTFAFLSIVFAILFSESLT